MKYTTDDLRTKWLDFWKSKNHVVIPSAGVIPDNDPTALFHNAGMHPLVPFLMGEKHPAGIRLANAQKCIRTIDIDEVGDDIHLTFFEMLGNWSLGDYFKKEQIAWSFEFLTKILKLPVEKIAVSVFAGDENAPRDEESAEFWQKQGIRRERIAYLDKKHNWWAKGDTGPCGPDTEMFFWVGDGNGPKNFQDTCEDPQWVEIWNDVFMQFNRSPDGKLTPLPQENIDTGMGLERTVAALNGLSSVYETDAFASILQKLSELSDNTENTTSKRIVADHLRTAVVILADKIAPSNLDQGYILRRLLRRAIRHGRKIDISGSFCKIIAKVVIEKLGKAYPEIKQNEAFILEELEREEVQFSKTLEKGEREFYRMYTKKRNKILHSDPSFAGNPLHIDGKWAFDLYQTYGFPIEMIEELGKEHEINIDIKEFEKEFKKHQALSRAGSEKKFKGGLGDHSERTTALHTATHLLHAGLRKVLGEHVEQRGSNITPERLRFDFSHPEKMTSEQIKEVEDFVNQAIQADVIIEFEEMSVDDAKSKNAIGLFEHKYGDKVKVYSMGEFSKEICGGPHVGNTGKLGKFKIKKEEASSRGVRRIKAVIEN
ncbi:alanine--tRNA ligase [Candidatus Gracilibacteria bacterium]|nr:alanine--tRNA ligase [Candidatus Gracilibacteria bacterium]